MRYGIFFHGGHFIVVDPAVVSGHQKLLHFAGFIKLHAGGHARRQDRAHDAVWAHPRAEDNTYRARRHAGQVAIDIRRRRMAHPPRRNQEHNPEREQCGQGKSQPARLLKKQGKQFANIRLSEPQQTSLFVVYTFE